MSTIENRTSAERAKTIEIEGVIDISDETTPENRVEPNEIGPQAQPPKKTPTRRPKKSAESTSPVTEATATPKPTKTSTKRRPKSVELVASTSETVDEPKPKRTTTRSRKKPVASAAPVTETLADPTSSVEISDVAAESTSVAETLAAPTSSVEMSDVAAESTSVAETLAAPTSSVEMSDVAAESVPGTEESLATHAVEIAPLAVAVEEVDSEPATTVEPVPALLDASESTFAEVEVASVLEEEIPTPVILVGEAPVNIEEISAHPPVTERRHLVKSAGLVSLGNLGSSVLGMVRQVALSRLGSLYAGPFIAALTPANNFYQLLVNGAVSGALIPAFNDYSASEKRHELRHIVFTLVNLILLITLVAAIGYTLISPWFIDALLSQLPGDQRGLALQYSQIIFFSLLALGPFSILLAALYALKEFGWPAFATAAYHIGIILGAVGVALFGRYYLGSIALPLGVLVGAVGEVALLLPGIRNQQLHYMFVLDLKHPALRHIFKLYLPVFLGFLFTTGAVLLDLSLQSQTSEHATAIAAMGFATTLIQFPVGLVAAALSFAVLPTLSEHVRESNDERFKQTLLLGFRLGLLLMIPAMVGLFALRTPITYLLFAHGKFGTSGADLTALALQNYAYQLPFIALDQLLIAAFYARKNTKTPVIIGVVAIFFYLIVALPFYRSIGVPALAFANTVQNSMHALILLFLLRRVMGALHIRTALPAMLKICVSAVLMGLATWGMLLLLSHVSLFSLQHIRGQLLTLIVAGGLAIAVYFGAVLLLKVEEVHLLKGAVLAKLGKR